MTPPTIAPVLLFEVADAFGALVTGGRPSTEEVVRNADVELAGSEEMIEEVDDGELLDGLARVEGAPCEV